MASPGGPVLGRDAAPRARSRTGMDFYLFRIVAVFGVLLLAGCAHGEYDFSEPTTTGDMYDMKMQHIQTSPVPGATARVFASPPGSTNTGPMVGDCVTDAGYCALAAQTPAGQNCLCQAGSIVYGGSTGIPKKYNSATNLQE